MWAGSAGRRLSIAREDVRFLQHIECPLLLFRIRMTLGVSPAMQAGIADRLWTMEELVEKMDVLSAPQARPV
ncbi:MAG TPA: hypothetical protein VJR87_08610 [Allosphingosinicella sp.]|nr:hypothetical protein [Allosphingosinicella sp.]